jgi:hypothetical protein
MADLPIALSLGFRVAGRQTTSFRRYFLDLNSDGWRHKEYERTRSFSLGEAAHTQTSILLPNQLLRANGRNAS